MLFNDFFCPTATFLINKLYSLTEDVNCKELRFDLAKQSRFNVKDWFMYCTKKLPDKLTQNLLKNYCNLSSLCPLYSGHFESTERCLDVCLCFKSGNLSLASQSLNFLPNFDLPLIPGFSALTSEFLLIKKSDK